MITDDWGCEIRGDVFESSGGFCITTPPEGLNSYEDRFIDVPRSYHGDASGIDVVAAKMLTFSWIVSEVSRDPRENLEDVYPLRQRVGIAFKPGRTSAEVALDVKVPGAPTTNEVLRFYGRPRGVLTRKNAVAGFEAILATFRALDPFGYGPIEAIADITSPIDLSVLGDIGTDRFTLTVSGNGGTPSITSATDGGSTISFQSSFSGVAILNFRTKSITVSGVDSYALLNPAPEWFILEPGTNQILFTGAASVTVAYEPAYL